jgi:hypothetical protein
MNRGSGLKRTGISRGSKRLRSRTTLKRHTAMPRAKVRPAVPGDVRAALARRSGGWCEPQLPGCWGQATDPSHRITTKNGGRHGAAKVEHDRLSDVVHACRLCHIWITTRPAEARALGLALEEWEDPSAEPVLLLAHDSEPVYLDDRGGVHSFEEAGT